MTETLTETVRDRVKGLKRIKASDLVPHPANWRIHGETQRKAMIGALSEIGCAGALVVRPKNGKHEILNGHLRAEIMPDQKVPCVVVDLDDDEAMKFLISYDSIGAMAEMDRVQLADLLSGVTPIDDGFSDLLDLLGEQAGPKQGPEDPGPQIDKADDLRKKWGTETGQLWELGEHRLASGDCTDSAMVDQIVGSELVELTVTSPPYGVGKSYESKGIGPWFETVRPAYKVTCDHTHIAVVNIGDLYPTGNQFIEPTFAYTISMMGENGFKPLWIRVWQKQGMNYGVGPYHLVSNKPVQQYEYIGAFSDDQEDCPEVAEFEWIVGFADSAHRFVKRMSRDERREWAYRGVWQINTVPQHNDHPATFPLELPERCIKMHTDIGDRVYDPFSGSGTTLIACERLDRKCVAVEIVPKYVAVSLERWATMTGQQPKLLK